MAALVQLFFFFQAEDGIRDYKVTGVQTLLFRLPMAWLYIRSRNICVPTFMHAFADVLWGFSGLLFPASNETATWAILQATQVVISAVLLRSLMAKPAEAAALAFKPLPV